MLATEPPPAVGSSRWMRERMIADVPQPIAAEPPAADVLNRLVRPPKDEVRDRFEWGWCPYFDPSGTGEGHQAVCSSPDYLLAGPPPNGGYQNPLSRISCATA